MWSGWLVFTTHRLLYHSTLGSRVSTKKKRPKPYPTFRARNPQVPMGEKIGCVVPYQQGRLLAAGIEKIYTVALSSPKLSRLSSKSETRNVKPESRT